MSAIKSLRLIGPFPMFALLLAALLLQRSAASGQQVYPVLYTHMAFSAQQIYDLPDVGLTAVANDFQIQFWDSRSQAYFGMLMIFSPENIVTQIRHMEYVKGVNQLAVIGQQINIAPDRTVSYKDYLFIYDLSTLSLVSPPVPNGMAELIKYVWGRKTIVPDLSDADPVFQYHYSEATGDLFTINRSGTLKTYRGGVLKNTLETHVTDSRILGVSADEDRVFLSDDSKAVFLELGYPDGRVRRSRKLLSLPTCNNNDALHAKDQNFGVREVAPAVFMLLDSINRIRVYDYNGGYDSTLRLAMPGVRLRSIDWDDNDSSILMIAESAAMNCKVISGKANIKTGQNNLFDNGNSEAGLITATFNNGQDAKLRILVPGYGEHETDLRTLTEKTIHVPGMPDAACTGSVFWEKGYVNIFASTGGGTRIDVFQADSLQTRLMYSQHITPPRGETLAGIRPDLKWWITTTDINKYEKGKMVLRIYDSTGKQLFAEAGCMPLQLLNSPYSGQQLFSSDERHMLIREFLGRVGNEDSFRIRVYNTSRFQPELDLRYTEIAGDVVPSCRAFFSKDSKRFCFTALSKEPWEHTVLYKYALGEGAAMKTDETRLCSDPACRLPVSVSKIGYWDDEASILFIGMVNTSTLAAQPNLVQVVRCIDASLYNQLWYMNLPYNTTVRKVLHFKDFVGLQYDNYVEFWKIYNNQFLRFLSLSPITNTASEGFSNLYLSSDPASPVPIYYEQTGNESLISFRQGNRSFRRSYFDLTFNRPDLIIDRVPGGDGDYKNRYYQAVLKRSEKVTTPTQDFNPDDIPEIKLVNVGYAGSRFRIRLAFKGHYPLRVLRVTINGSSEEKDISGYSNYDCYETLTYGENRLKLSVVDDHQRESLPLNVVQNNFRPMKKPVLHMLVLSVRHYDNGKELTIAVQKGRDMAALFKGLDDTIFAARSVDTFFNEEVTQDKVLAWIDSLKEEIGRAHV